MFYVTSSADKLVLSTNFLAQIYRQKAGGAICCQETSLLHKQDSKQSCEWRLYPPNILYFTGVLIYMMEELNTEYQI